MQKQRPIEAWLKECSDDRVRLTAGIDSADRYFEVFKNLDTGQYLPILSRRATPHELHQKDELNKSKGQVKAGHQWIEYVRQKRKDFLARHPGRGRH